MLQQTEMTKLTLVYALLVGVSLHAAFAVDFDQNKGQFIKNVGSGLYLDGSEEVLTIEKFKDDDKRRWFVQHFEKGRIIIINKNTK